MKKFGKIFGVATLAFATLTAGIIGLAGCADKYKNPDKTPDPQEPPIIVTPPAEEKPLVGVVSMDEIKAYMNKDDVDTTFKGLKVVSNVPSFSEEVGFSEIELYGMPKGEGNGADFILVEKYADGSVLTNYLPNGSESLFVMSETKSGVVKEKISDAETVEAEKAIMTSIYTQMTDAKTQIAEFETIQNQSTKFKSVAVRTIFKETTSFEINYTCQMMEDDSGEDAGEEYQVNYTGKFVLNFVNSKIQSMETETVRKRVDNGDTMKTNASVEAIETLEMPEDFSDYATVENLTLDEFQSFLSTDAGELTFDGLEVSVERTIADQAGEVTELSGPVSILKESENVKAIIAGSELGMEGNADNATYYFAIEDGVISVYKVEGGLTTKVEDESVVESLDRRQQSVYLSNFDVNVHLSNLLKNMEQDADKLLTVNKRTYDDRVEYVVMFSYIEKLDTDDQSNGLQHSGEICFTFVEGQFQGYSVFERIDNLDYEGVFRTENRSVKKIDTIEFPNFSVGTENEEAIS